MARIPYADTADPQIRDLVERITRERGSVLHLYAMLLHSGPVAEGWLRYLTAIRHECTLPGALRELVVMRIAQLNGAPYEAEQHAPIALHEGVTQAQIDALDRWQGSNQFDAIQRAVLAYCDAMTRTVHVPDEVFAAVREALGNRHLVELTATVGAYNMVSRFLEAMRIDARDDLASGARSGGAPAGATPKGDGNLRRGPGRRSRKAGQGWGEETLMLRLDGKVAIVTGAGSAGPGWGNGKATAVLLARQGAAVFAVEAWF